MGQSEAAQERLTLDREHTMQVGLLDLLGQATGEARPDSEQLEILDQLLSFSDVHFLSEQLMMRQYNYPGYDEHVAEHDTLVAMLREMKSALTQDTGSLEGPQINALQDVLLKHITLEDRRFAGFLQGVKKEQRGCPRG